MQPCFSQVKLCYYNLETHTHPKSRASSLFLAHTLKSNGQAGLGKQADVTLALSCFANGSLEQTGELLISPRQFLHCSCMKSARVSRCRTHFLFIFLLSQCRQRPLMTLSSSCPDPNGQHGLFRSAVVFSSLASSLYCWLQIVLLLIRTGLLTCSERALLGNASVIWLWFNWGSCVFLSLHRAAVRLGEDRGPAVWHVLCGVSDVQNADSPFWEYVGMCFLCQISS